jgi:hypothetical protein
MTHAIALHALHVLDQPEYTADHDHHADSVQQLDGPWPVDIRRESFQSKVVDDPLVEDSRCNHEQPEREDLDHQAEDHHGLADGCQVLDHQHTRGTALEDECEDVAADEELREQAHAHDGVILGAHHGRQAPEHHVDRSSEECRREQGEGVLHGVRDNDGSIVVSGYSSAIADHFDYMRLSVQLRHNPADLYLVRLTERSYDERDAPLDMRFP